RLILKEMQCKKVFSNPCKSPMAPLFGNIDSFKKSLAFVLDVSGSMGSAQCFGMSCYDYLLASFHSQLNKLDKSARVQIYLYLDIRDGGKKLFAKPVTSTIALDMMKYLQEKELIRSSNKKLEESMGIEFMPTSVFFLDDLLDQDFDQVFIFSDFMD